MSATALPRIERCHAAVRAGAEHERVGHAVLS
jgi:hypothetical protein